MATGPTAKVEPNDWKTVDDWQDVSAPAAGQSHPLTRQEIIAQIPKGAKMSDLNPSQFSRSLGQVKEGISSIKGGDVAHGAHQIIGGVGSELGAAALPIMAMNPVAALAGLGTGTVAGGAARFGSRLLGASPGVSELAGDVAGIGAGGMAAKFSPKGIPAAPDIVPGVKGALRGGLDAAKKIPMVGKVLEIPEAMGRGYQAGIDGPRSVYSNVSLPTVGRAPEPMGGRSVPNSASLPTEGRAVEPPITRSLPGSVNLPASGRAPDPFAGRSAPTSVSLPSSAPSAPERSVPSFIPGPGRGGLTGGKSTDLFYHGDPVLAQVRQSRLATQQPTPMQDFDLFGRPAPKARDIWGREIPQK